MCRTFHWIWDINLNQTAKAAEGEGNTIFVGFFIAFFANMYYAYRAGLRND